jgi:phage terminase small subunit
MKGSEDMLTPKQEKFVQGLIQGMSQADAYRSAYSTKNMSDKTIYEAASRLVADSNVSARLKELRDQMTKETIMTAQDRLEWLTNVINSDKESTTDKLKAADIMNKMQGEYVQKVQTTISYEDRLKSVVDEDEY